MSTKTPPKTPSPLPLSFKEMKVLEFIEEFFGARGVAPTYQEIREHFGFASFNSVQRYLKQLQEKHYLRLAGANQKRALRVINSSRSSSLPTSPPSAMTTDPFATQNKKRGMTPKSSSPPSVESLSLPLLGRVAAGSPIEAFTDNEFVDVPAHLVRNPAKTFALIVQGQSMIEDGILDGDVIFVQKQSYANNGETVVAMINNQATVKRFYIHKPTAAPRTQSHPSEHRVELRPANSTMDSMWYPPAHVDIQGIVVGLIRRF